MASKPRAPLTDAIVIALARLVDDAQTETREPSHYDIEFEIKRAGLTAGDPRPQGHVVGKAKRVRAVLSWALEHAPDQGEVFVAAFLAMLRGKGGFRKESPNFVGSDALVDASEAFKTEGFVLSQDGDLRPTSIDTLVGTELTMALESYVRRARRGSEDAALLVGTGKDLVEATAAHVIQERFGQYPAHAHFGALLGQAFVAVGMITPQTAPQPGDPPQYRLHRALAVTIRLTGSRLRFSTSVISALPERKSTSSNEVELTMVGRLESAARVHRPDPSNGPVSYAAALAHPGAVGDKPTSDGID